MDERSLIKHLMEIDKRLERVEHYMLWGSIVGTLRLIIIVIPIVLAVIYIPPFIQQYAPFTGQIKNAITRFLDQTHQGSANSR